MAFESVVHRVLRSGAERGAAVAYAARDESGWTTTSWAEYASQVRTAAKALIALGVNPGAAVCLFGSNQPEWAIFDMAAMAVGGCPAGIYPANTAEESAYIIGHSEAPVLLVQNAERLERILAKRPDLPGLHHIVMMGEAPPGVPGVLSWAEFLAGGSRVPDEALQARLDAIGPRDAAALVYTSGTTGQPKAVVLPHEALAYMAKALTDIIAVGPADRVISYLPLSHIAEQLVSLLTPPIGGHVTYYEPDLRRLVETIKEVRPTAFFAVPRVWEKFSAGAAGALGGLRGLKRALANGALAVGRRHVETISRGERPGALLRAGYRLFDGLVFAPAKGKMGLDQSRFLFSSAAPLSPAITAFFAGLGMQILNLYGLSECTGLCAVNRPDWNRIGSVGTALPGVELRVAGDGEILSRGPNSLLGYLKDAEATTQVRDAEGFVHTGDVGRLDADGFLYITDRKKDVIITAGGENVNPSLIEIELKKSPVIGDAVVIGDERPYLTVLVSLDAEAVAERGLDAAGVQAAIQAAVSEVNRGLAPVRQVKRFSVLGRPLSIERGELTPTAKVRRKAVRENFAAEIEAMYR